LSRNNKHAFTTIAAAALVVFSGGLVRAAGDHENCLSCHDPHRDASNPCRYNRIHTPHTDLRCTDCHEPDELAVVPHQTVTPVDCTRACHTSKPPEMLEASAHTTHVLDRANRLLGSPLRTGQSQCLLCHTTAARTHEDIVRLCARCHAHPAIRGTFGLPNSVASYLASCHGQAMLLGNRQTAGCLACHVGETQNVHQIRSHQHPASATHPRNLPNTCRRPPCHPTAGYRISTAAVHLDLSTGRGTEFLIACMFVLLIAFTFGPAVVITALEMLQIVIGRHDGEYRRNRRLADRLLADPQGRRLLTRFTPHQRLQHWILAACFIVLAITGFPMKFADHAWAEWMIDHVGGLARARAIHRTTGVLLMAAFVYHLGYLARIVLQRKRHTGGKLIRTILDLPMVMSTDDWKQMFGLLAYLLFLRRKRPQAERFSAVEKFEYFGVYWGVILLSVTGVLMWANGWTTRYLTGRVLTFACLVHTFEAFLALLQVGIIHTVTVVLSPHVWPISPAMFTGTTPPAELAEEHADMLAHAAAKLQIARVDDD